MEFSTVSSASSLHLEYFLSVFTVKSKAQHLTWKKRDNREGGTLYGAQVCGLRRENCGCITLLWRKLNVKMEIN